MKILLQSSQFDLVGVLFRENEEVIVHGVPDEDLFDVLSTSLCDTTEEQVEPEASYDCIILNSDNIEVLNTILDFIMASMGNLNKRPRIILLSKLLSWGGKKYKVPIGCNVSEFNARKPYLTEELLYKIENKFQTCAALTKLDMCILGVGLIYGSKGYDFAELLMNLFIAEQKAEEIIFSPSQGANIVPTIHFDDLVRIIEHLSTMPEAFHNFFIPAVDFSTEPLHRVFESLSATSRRTVRCTTEDEAIEIVMNSNSSNPHHKWDLDMSFSDSHRIPGFTLRYPNGLINNSAEVWREFQMQSCSQPCSILVAGPPCSLKTTIAMDLAKALGLKYVDWKVSVKYCLQNFVEMATTEAIEKTKSFEAETIDLTKVTNEYVALRVEIERAIKVYKKMKDDATLDLKDIVFDKQLLSTLPKSLIVEAVGALVFCDEQCQKRGYVLDIWGPDEQIIVGRDQIYEVTNTRPPISSHPIADTKVAEDGVDQNSLESETSFHFKESSTIEKKPQLIVELQCETATSIKQFLAPLGIVQQEGAKMNKEQLAHIKDIESRTAHYNSLLKPLAPESSDQETEVKPETTATATYTTLSHPVIQQCHSEGFEVLRLDVNNMPPIIVSDKETEVAESGKESARDKSKPPTSARTDKSSGKKDSTENCQEVKEEDVSAVKDSIKPIDPTEGVIKEIYERYAIAFGALDWVDIKIGGYFPASGLEINETLVANFCDSADAIDEYYDIDAELMQNEDDITSCNVAAPPNRIDELNSTLQSLGADMCKVLRPSCDKLNNYLVENVLSHVAEALVIIHRDKIEDPMMFMSNFLRKRGEEVEVAETEHAYEKYIAAMKEAEMLEQEAAQELQCVVESSCDEWD